jgi:hypothetical protein
MLATGMFIATILVLTLRAHAEDPASLTFSAEVFKKTPYALKFTPPKGHHFNLQAPASVELANGSTNALGALVKGPQLVTAQDFKEAKLEKDCTVKASLYVCNDANTYCRPVKQDFDCETLALKK